MSDTTLLPIGALSDATGVSVSTLRYYDEVGLIEPECRVGGKRRFGPAAPGRVNFVRRAQGVGFSLDQIRRLLDDKATRWPDLVAEQLAVLRSQRDELDTMIAMLDDVRDCGCASVATCPRVSDGC